MDLNIENNFNYGINNELNLRLKKEKIRMKILK
jgi:hypothetical protein